MRTRFVANAPWAQAIVKGSRGLLRSQIPDQYLPLEPSQMRLPFPGVVQISEEFDEYGEGHYGVVFPTHHPCMVFKLTTDVHEAFFALVQNDGHRDIEGVIKYHCCVFLGYGTHTDPKTGHQSTRPVFAVVRDDVDDVGFIAREDEATFLRLGRRSFPDWLSRFKEHAHQAMMSLAEARTDYGDDLDRLYGRIRHWIANFERAPGLEYGDTSALDQAVAAVTYGDEFEWSGKDVEPRVWHAIAADYVVASMLADENTSDRTSAYYPVAAALRDFAQLGVLLADVHGNNIGRVKLGCAGQGSSSGPAKLIISDPGHAVDVDGGFEKQWNRANDPGSDPVLVRWWE